MIGSIIGDIVGSIYEFDNIKTKDFSFFQKEMEYTDDSVLTFATAEWLLRGGNAADFYAKYVNDYPYPMGGYGTYFKSWAIRYNRGGYCEPYNSCGNGSAMRVGPVGWAFNTEEETVNAAAESAKCTHNHPGGIAGAQATALCILWARHGKTKDFIRAEIEKRFGYNLSVTVDYLNEVYSWSGLPDEEWRGGTCQGSVPQAIVCALEADGFEDAVRNAISIGGDSDTIGCIAGSIAEALYGVPDELRNTALGYLPAKLKAVLSEFESKYNDIQQ